MRIGIKTITGLGIAFVIALVIFMIIGNPNTNNTGERGFVLDQISQGIEDVGLTQEEVEEGLDLQVNGANGIYQVNLLTGSFEGEVEGIVRSDTDCKVDKEGVSRCHNEIELDNQKKVTIANPHNMRKNRCLKPGEKVRLTISDEGKVKVELTDI